MSEIALTSIKNKETAVPIDRFLEGEKIPHHWENTRGGHYRCVFEYAGQERGFVIAKTPSDHRGSLNALSDIKRTLSSLGWQPSAPAEKPPRVLKVHRSSLKKLKSIEDDVTSVIDENENPLFTLRGLVVPPCPEEYVNKRLPLGRQKGELADALVARRVFVREVHDRGTNDVEISEALQKAGWYMSPSLVASIRNRKTAVDRKKTAKEPEVKVNSDEIAAKIEKFAGGALGFIEIEGNIKDTLTRLLTQFVQLHTVRIRRELDEAKADLEREKKRADDNEAKARAYDRMMNAVKCK